MPPTRKIKIGTVVYEVEIDPIVRKRHEGEEPNNQIFRGWRTDTKDREQVCIKFPVSGIEGTLTTIANEQVIYEHFRESANRNNQKLADHYLGFGPYIDAETSHQFNLEGLVLKDLSGARAGQPPLRQTLAEKLWGKNVSPSRQDIKDKEGKKIGEALYCDPLKPLDALSCYLALLTELKKVHEEGVLHDDLDPTNMFFEPAPGGKAKAILHDFGISKKIEQELGLLFLRRKVRQLEGYYTGTNGVMRNVHLHAPEAEDPDAARFPALAAQDVYCATDLLCLMLTGEQMRYWRNKYGTDDTKIAKEIRGALQKSQFNEQDKEKIVKVILKGTHYQKPPEGAKGKIGSEERYQSCQEILDELKEISLETLYEVSYPRIDLGKYGLTPETPADSIIPRPSLDDFLKKIGPVALKKYEIRPVHFSLPDRAADLEYRIPRHRRWARTVARFAAGLAILGGLAYGGHNLYQIHQASQPEYQPQIIIENRVVEVKKNNVVESNTPQ